MLLHWNLEQPDGLLRRVFVPDDSLLALPVNLPYRSHSVLEIVRRLVTLFPSKETGFVGPSVVAVCEGRRWLRPDDGLMPEDIEFFEHPVDDRVLKVRVPDVDASVVFEVRQDR